MTTRCTHELYEFKGLRQQQCEALGTTDFKCWTFQWTLRRPKLHLQKWQFSKWDVWVGTNYKTVTEWILLCLINSDFFYKNTIQCHILNGKANQTKVKKRKKHGNKWALEAYEVFKQEGMQTALLARVAKQELPSRRSGSLYVSVDGI